ncbi:neuropeptide CCHamide-1 receptor [Cherax quadricarinatus]|uniref:neuropeptide CCHamide-1 receptor n=1 Tax=Cherax quadricarinatus TaxID=27406 RepID=UPI002379B8C6|nr:neuropeptide CCHamide-1 receptor-like [Cherax quadricarinatus]
MEDYDETRLVTWVTNLTHPMTHDEFEDDEDAWYVNATEAATEEVGRNLTEYTPYSQRPETYLVPIVFALIFVTGVVGNGALIFMFVKHPKLRSTPNTHLVSLAAGDLLMVLLTVPFTSLVYTLDSYPFGEAVCRASEFAKDLSLGITVFTLTALSADRYMAIVRPVSHHVSDSAGRLTIMVAVGIWVVAALLATPAALFSSTPTMFTPTGKQYHICTPFPEYLGPLYPKIHALVKVIGYYILPLALIASFYILMARHLLVSAQHLPGEAAGQQRQAQARRKVAKMVLAFVIIFAICFLPLNVFTLWWHFAPNSVESYDIYWHSLRIVGFCLSFINSCINPIALYCVSGTFRKYFNKHVFCWCASRGGRFGRAEWDAVDSTGTRVTTALRTEQLPLKTIGTDNGTQASHHRLTLTNTTILNPRPHNPTSFE